MEYYKLKGFSLAEVLLGLTIVGVIAAILISPLINHLNEEQLRIAWKSTYARLSNATQMMTMQDFGGDLSNLYNEAHASWVDERNLDYIRDNFAKYLNSIKECDVYSSLGNNGCWHEEGNWTTLSGGEPLELGGSGGTPYIAAYHSRMVLNNGVLIAFRDYSIGCNGSSVVKNDACGSMVVDVNGFSKPNKVGKDIYAVQITKTGALIPYGTKNDAWDNDDNICDLKVYSYTTGWNCSSYYLINR